MNAFFPFFIPTPVLTSIVNLMLWPLPEFDMGAYLNRRWYEHCLRSDVLPYTPGI